ncbi:pilin [Dokdonella sp.]|uniref:pilin n=1 Tax=Dokdonella sp. TaxID=2291710 RepID=UPI003C64A446
MLSGKAYKHPLQLNGMDSSALLITLVPRLRTQPGEDSMSGPASRPRSICPSGKRTAGFTMVELMIVVSVIGILSAIALPAYRDYLLRSKVAESLMLLGDSKAAINDFHSRWGRMPANNVEAGMRAPLDLRGTYVRSIDVLDGALVASMELGLDSDQQVIERTLTLRPWVNIESSGSPIIWSCGEQEPGATDNYLPVGSVAAKPVEARWLPTLCRK